MREVRIKNIRVGANNPLVLIAGPCVIESEKLCLDSAKRILDITSKLNIPYIFKSSFDKANRLSIESFRGPGIKRGLAVLHKVKQQLKIPVLSDVHCIKDIAEAAKVLDIIQIPAFLSRQTDIVVAAGRTGKVVNIKKGQFLAPWDILPLFTVTILALVGLFSRNKMIGLAVLVWVIITAIFSIVVAIWKLKYDKLKYAQDYIVTCLL